MKNAVTLLAIAGIATVAGAQTATLSIVLSTSTTFTTGAAVTMTLAVYGDADFGTALGGGGFGLVATGGEGLITGMTVSVADWGALGFEDQGDGGDGNYNGVVFGQLIFPPFIPASDDSLLGNGPVLIATFTVTLAADALGVIDWSTVGGLGDFDLEIFDDATGLFTQITDAQQGSARVSVVPAPSALAMLGLGGLAASRRRR
ncbi:hypothetical protein COB72_02510 [bacterium]|nr:MAG: hypothetical protein COB72_02510 [bacterium]